MNYKEKYEPILKKINTLLEKKEPVYVAIDGKCGAGKSTLAMYLKQVYSASLIRMDDFFLQPYQRTEERYNQAGGNVDYERFEIQVIQNLKKHSDFSYTFYNCMTHQLEEEIEIKKNKLYIIEGSYSFHHYFTLKYDLKIFLDIDKDIQLQRIKNRNGEDKLKMFIDLWIPYENNYFDTYNIKEKADIVINGN